MGQAILYSLFRPQMIMINQQPGVSYDIVYATASATKDDASIHPTHDRSQ